MIQVLHLDAHTATLTQLLAGRWQAHRLKKRDRVWVSLACSDQGIVKATTPRRVSLMVTMGARRRTPDPDAFFKSLLDSLVHAGALVDDRKEWVVPGPVHYQRGAQDAMDITLEDLGEPKEDIPCS